MVHRNKSDMKPRLQLLSDPEEPPKLLRLLYQFHRLAVESLLYPLVLLMELRVQLTQGALVDCSQPLLDLRLYIVAPGFLMVHQLSHLLSESNYLPQYMF